MLFTFFKNIVSTFCNVVYDIHCTYSHKVYSTIFPKLDLESKPEIHHIGILARVLFLNCSEIKFNVRGFIDLCSEARFSGPSSGNGSPIGRSNSTAKVYFVGKDVSPIVQTNVNGHARHSSVPSESNKFDKV